MMALDERSERDEVLVIHGVPIILDPFTASLAQEPLIVEYDEYEDSFAIHSEGAGDSQC
ncbi:MAG: hypothetical protein OWR52_12010 [Acidibacillus sp.]|uniref:Uncharacterized protein n=1 Tax=Sulfoacidibacillus ferrooxidans TaxID=2005001 RepID=A0A9X2ADW6_9BACL|nr:hypothetical protein [Sulfoacidibacillus ferrooxidans]MCI0182516.1 hypothetical protein [Sulfoacidibacillus ferrooxidans]MCY0894209.1 hypothetical protein [Acidibacillus sp.]